MGEPGSDVVIVGASVAGCAVATLPAPVIEFRRRNAWGHGLHMGARLLNRFDNPGIRHQP